MPWRRIIKLAIDVLFCTSVLISACTENVREARLIGQSSFPLNVSGVGVVRMGTNRGRTRSVYRPEEREENEETRLG